MKEKKITNKLRREKGELKLVQDLLKSLNNEEVEHLEEVQEMLRLGPY